MQETGKPYCNKMHFHRELPPELIEQTNDLLKALDERMELAESMNEAIKDSEVDIKRLRALEDSAKSDIVLAFALALWAFQCLHEPIITAHVSCSSCGRVKKYKTVRMDATLTAT